MDDLPSRPEFLPAIGSDSATGVLIAVSFYKNEALAAPLIGSLIRCASDIIAIGGKVVVYNDSPDYDPLEAALSRTLATIQGAFPWRLHHNSTNLGFVRTMNLAIAEAVATGSDILLLNSDTMPEPGAFVEMMRVAALDPMTAFINPRSNNATIATLPVHGRVGASPSAADAQEKLRTAMLALSARLPEYSYIPTAIGFCMLIRWHILAEFGGFDEIYGAGYNEENDLVMRAARCGYRAVMANHALVWHEGEASFSQSSVKRDIWEKRNRAILDARYPEYGGYTGAYSDTPEVIAESLLSCLVPDQDGKLDLALDYSSFRADHNGTFQAGYQLLKAAVSVWGDRFHTFVICSEDVYRFHDYAALGAARSDPHSGRKFAVVFRLGQPYDWNSVERLAVSGAVTGVYMLDTISVDCPQLTSPFLMRLWQFTLYQADLIATQSLQTQAQFEHRFHIPAHAVQIMAHHSLDLNDYKPKPAAPPTSASKTRPCILVVGNHFPHKYVLPTIDALVSAFPNHDIVALGAGLPPASASDPIAERLRAAANLKTYAGGSLEAAEVDALYLSCDAVVFPSHAEGFGFPVLNALAAERPLFVRRLPVFEELWSQLGHTRNIHFFRTTTDLITELQTPPHWIDRESPNIVFDAADSAKEILKGIDTALGRIEFHRIVDRIRAVQTVSGMPRNTDRQIVGYESQADMAARLAGEQTHRLARSAFANPVIFKASRLLFRTVRWLARR